MQLAFVRKELETKTVNDSEVIQHAFEIAIANAMRKKGRKPQELWKKFREEKKEPPVSKKEFDALKAAFASMHRRR